MSFLKKSLSKAKDLYFDQAQELGFVQFLQTISVTFFAIPISWLLIFWFGPSKGACSSIVVMDGALFCLLGY
ncbi:MAG: hypothetical protein LRY63_14390 [Nitrincola sp.]|nr:hypothetical protein [Nitrincola sp.]